MVRRMKARKAKALNPVWGGQAAAADLPVIPSPSVQRRGGLERWESVSMVLVQHCTPVLILTVVLQVEISS